MNKTDMVRNLAIGECYSEGRLVSSLLEAEKERLRLQQKLKTIAYRATRQTGNKYITTTIKCPVYSTEVFVAVLIKRVK